jgi:Uma2 family endonuclease
MSEALREDGRMTLEAFRSFAEDRPHWEKWELIDGELTMQATPARRHQLIVDNLAFQLGRIRRETSASWQSFAGIGTRVPGDHHNEIIPDVMVLPPGDDLTNWTYDIIVAFEVLSPGSVRRDLVLKRAIYQRMRALTHYFVVAQAGREVTVFARAAAFEPRRLTGDAMLEISGLGVTIPLAEIYRDVGLN